jgi:hypothetical protein
MFSFVIKYLGFLKVIPGLALLFDAMLKLYSLISRPYLLDWIDGIEKEALKWDNISTTIHKYGGLQINYGKTELGHLHSNGLLDMPFNRKIKQTLMLKYSRVQEHHTFKNTGWISFYIERYGDNLIALELLQQAYNLHADKRFNN